MRLPPTRRGDRPVAPEIANRVVEIRRENPHPTAFLHALTRVTRLGARVWVATPLEFVAPAKPIVWLIEEEDRAGILGGVEHGTQVLFAFADVLADAVRS
jgi:hypothetical protein